MRPEKKEIDPKAPNLTFDDFKEGQVCKQIMDLPEDKFEEVIASFGKKLKWNEEEVEEMKLMKYSSPYVTSLYKGGHNRSAPRVNRGLIDVTKIYFLHFFK